ncbi:fluoride efflux transporter CrcB, partial [Dermatophilus congolensis]
APQHSDTTSPPKTHPMNALLVAIGGAIGAITRHLITTHTPHHTFPWGILTANTLGSLLINLITTITTQHTLTPLTPTQWQLLLTTGYCGALTTYSTFAADTTSQLRHHRYATACINTAANLTCALAAAAIGTALGTSLS